MTKTYVCKNRKVLSYPILIGKILHTIKFRGGEPPKRLSSFMTNNIQLQEAIEKNPGYGTIFELDAVSKKQSKIFQQRGNPKKYRIGNTIVTKLGLKEEKKEEKGEEKPPTIVHKITSGQKAKLHMMNIEELDGKLTRSMLVNNPKIIETAKKFNIVFPDWPQFNE